MYKKIKKKIGEAMAPLCHHVVPPMGISIPCL